jgi:hypothetical protein
MGTGKMEKQAVMGAVASLTSPADKEIFLRRNMTQLLYAANDFSVHLRPASLCERGRGDLRGRRGICTYSDATKDLRVFEARFGYHKP